MGAAVAFRASDIRRAVEAVEKGGKCVSAVDFPKEGGFRLLIGSPIDVGSLGPKGANEWDEVLPGA